MNPSASLGDSARNSFWAEIRFINLNFTTEFLLLKSLMLIDCLTKYVKVLINRVSA